ncbi:MAG: hypothetical protein IKH26_13465 [Bacteroidaceae bacterium]|nr:hypothetical protein [Bacteroidaceae bacterium]
MATIIDFNQIKVNNPRVEDFCIAGFVVRLVMNEETKVWNQLDQYKPFVIAHSPENKPLFTMSVVEKENWAKGENYVEEYRQKEQNMEIAAGYVDGYRCYMFVLDGFATCRVIANKDFSQVIVLLTNYELYGLNNAMMLTYAFATASRQTVLFHSSVTVLDDYAYMFLGKSGTGKSTHSQLWLKNFQGAHLLNDDNPVMRVEDGRGYVYGTPWSGKTPCYRNLRYPIGALVQLKQAPYNKITRLTPLKAYSYMLPSISGIRWDKTLSEGIHETENWIASNLPVFYLECLPDDDAARLSHSEIVVKEK